MIQTAPVAPIFRRAFTDRARTPRLRSMRDFAESEIVLPAGPKAGRRFKVSYQPWSGLFFDAVESAMWNRIVATGPSQAGKTLLFFVIPILYYLFEIGTTVVLGAPTMVIARDKWEQDLEPVISRTRFANLFPRIGTGSRSGFSDAVTFRNGATLRTMTGGGSDKSRASYTARALFVTESEGLAVMGGSSAESTKLRQLEARTRAFGDDAIVYKECTVTTEEGDTWKSYTEATESKIAMPCPHCAAYVTPERKHFRGWEKAENVVDAADLARFHCPSCGAPWSDDERRAAAAGSVLCHRGQSVDNAGQVVGPVPKTDTLGFRFSAVDNMFATSRQLGADEWRATRADDDDAAERMLCQFVWAVPYVSPDLEIVKISERGLLRRVSEWPRHRVPDNFVALTTGVDIGRYWLWYVTVAWFDGASSVVVDYARHQIETDEYGQEAATLAALRTLRKQLERGYASESEGVIVPEQVFVDHGYQSPIVDRFCRESATPTADGQNRDRIRPIKGHGIGQRRLTPYKAPTSKQKTVYRSGDYHIVARPGNVPLVHANVDSWKTFLHQRLAVPASVPGAMLLFAAPPHEHRTIARHFTAEHQREEFVPGVGEVIRWEAKRKNNHLFDCACYASVAAHFCGVRLIEEEPPATMQPDGRIDLSPDTDDRAYLLTER